MAAAAAPVITAAASALASEAAKIGADVATAPPGVIKKMAEHVLTDKGLAQFLKDAESAGIKIV